MVLNWINTKTLSSEELTAIDKLQNKIQYVACKVIAPYNTAYEDKYITGLLTGGSINVDGKSAVRRTGSLSFITTEDNDISDLTNLENDIAIDKEIQVYIGIEDADNPGTIYRFNQGHFVIKNASLSRNNQGVNISVTLSDLMSKLNGDVGGVLPNAMTHSPELSETEVDDKGNPVKNPVLFTKIIQTLVHEFGGIDFDKIKLNEDDFPERIKNTVRWVGNKSIYTYPIDDDGKLLAITTLNPGGEKVTSYDFNDNIGYQYTDFTYPGELSSNAGETVVSVLDKIKNTLGNYEYFFDLDGNFVFQEIKNYLNDEGSDKVNITDAIGDRYLYPPSNEGKAVYEFNDATLVTAYQNQPQWNNIKNDITVWGKRGDKTAIWYHLIIGKKYPARDGNDWRTQLVLDYNDKKSEVMDTYWLPYAKELAAQWPTVYDIEKDTYKFEGDIKLWLNNLPYYFDALDPDDVRKSKTEKVKDEEGNETEQDKYTDDQKQQIEAAALALESISVERIGRRQQVLNNDKINTLFSPDYPDVIYIEAGQGEKTKKLREEALTKEDPFIQVPTSIAKGLSIGSVINAAYENVRAMIHETTSYNENISVSCIPIFHLEPNTRIKVEDDESHIHGDYMLNSFSIPLDPNGIMTLNCSKAVERI